MIYLENDIEKELWRASALAAVQTVEGVGPSDDKKVLLFSLLIADNIIREYRKRTQGSL